MSLHDDFERLQHPLPRFYASAVIGSLLITALILFERNMNLVAFVLLLLGAFGLYSRWRMVPIALLLFLTFALILRAYGHDFFSFLYRAIFPWMRIRGYGGDYEAEPLLDAIMALALLVYLMGQYRLTGFLTQALPQEGRLASDRQRPILRGLPPTEGGEGLGGLTLMVIVLILAIFTWVLITATEPPTEMSLTVWRTLLLAWILGTSLILGSTLLRIAFFRAAPPEVHEMYLQDTLWRETRSELSRVHRWSMKYRLRAQKRREK